MAHTWSILVVEDDPDGQEVVSRILAHHRIPFRAVQTGEDALEYLATEDYTAAIIDLALPGLDGWQLLNEIRSQPHMSAMPCVAITAFHSAEVAAEARMVGFNAYLPKPLNAATFVQTLETVLENY